MFERNNGLSTKSLYDKSAEVAISSSRLQGEQERRRHTTLHDRGTDNHYDDDDDDDEFLDRNNYVEALAGHQVYAHFKLAEVVTSSRILRGDQDRRRTTLHDRETDSHYDGSQDRKSHVEGLAENVNQSLRYRIDENDHKDEDVYFDDESAEVVISTLRLGDNQESGSLFANSNWFAFDDEKVVHEQSSSAVASQSQDTGGGTTYDGEITANKNGNNLVDSATYEAHGSLERDDEDVYFDDESAEVIISSLRLGNDQEGGSLFTNSNWFAFEDEKVVHEQSTSAVACQSQDTGGGTGTTYGGEITANKLVDSSTYEAHDSLERDDEDVYFDDESAEVVISSLRLGDDQEGGSLFTNSNWFAFEDERVVHE